MEQMDYNLLFRWFVGLGIDDAVWVPTVFTKNRDRLLMTEMSRKVMAAILAHPEVRPLLSDEHFSVDGTLVKAWAAMKSFQPKTDDAGPSQPHGPPGEGPENAPPDKDDPGSPPPSANSATPEHLQQTETQKMPETPRQTRNAEVNFRGEKRSNATHASVTDPDARLYKKSPGAAATLCFMGHTLMENRNGLVVQADLTHADGFGERKAALDMINRHAPGSTRRRTLGADKGYDSADFVRKLRGMVFGAETIPRIVSKGPSPPHIAQKARHSAIDGRTTHEHQFTERRACRLVGISRSSLACQARSDRHARLRKRLITLSGKHSRYGCRMLHAKLAREGFRVNVKVVERLYREERLRKQRRALFSRRTPTTLVRRLLSLLPRPGDPNSCGSTPPEGG